MTTTRNVPRGANVVVVAVGGVVAPVAAVVVGAVVAVVVLGSATVPSAASVATVVLGEPVVVTPRASGFSGPVPPHEEPTSARARRAGTARVRVIEAPRLASAVRLDRSVRGTRYRGAVWIRGLLKGIGLTVLMGASTFALWYGAVHLLLGRPWWRLVGLVLVVGGFRGFVLAFDLMWGRPPAFSKRPWERPWEEEARHPPGW
jgi:hypothetical protein